MDVAYSLSSVSAVSIFLQRPKDNHFFGNDKSLGRNIDKLNEYLEK